MIMLFS